MIELKTIQELSISEPKTLLERFAKLAEECGELAQELLIQNNASGFAHKKQGEDGVMGETVDVLLVAFSIFFKSGGSEQQLVELLNKKCDKWRKWQHAAQSP